MQTGPYDQVANISEHVGDTDDQRAEGEDPKRDPKCTDNAHADHGEADDSDP